MVSKTRVARCACGAVSATATGEPDFVVLCNCTQCQRRSGGPFEVGAHFRRETVIVSGTTKKFVRSVEGANRAITNHFCADCGVTLYWILDLRPQYIGIAVGCFSDPDFGRPTRAVWTEHKHEWISLPTDIPAFSQAAS